MHCAKKIMAAVISALLEALAFRAVRKFNNPQTSNAYV